MTENTENGDATKPTGPIEVWIRQKKLTGFTCMVVYDDESTYEFDLVSRTLAAAQQEASDHTVAISSRLARARTRRPLDPRVRPRSGAWLPTS